MNCATPHCSPASSSALVPPKSMRSKVSPRRGFSTGYPSNCEALTTAFAPASASLSDTDSNTSACTKSQFLILSLARAAAGFRVSTRTVVAGIAAIRRAMLRPIKPLPPAIAIVRFSIDLLAALPGGFERLAPNHLAAATPRFLAAIGDDYLAARNRDRGPARDFEALERIVVGARVHLGAVHDHLALGLEDDQVGVRPFGDHALLRIHAEDARGIGRDQIDHALKRDAVLFHTFRIEHRHEGLEVRHPRHHAREAVRRELVVERPAAVIGRDHVHGAVGQRLPDG